MELIDATGKGYGAKVDDEHRLQTKSLSISQVVGRSGDGDAYYLNTGFIALTTTGSFSGLLYIKNTAESTKNLHIESIRTCGNMTYHQTNVYKNPTTGTLISDATAATVVNANFTSSETIEADVYKGADAKTVTDGTVLTHWQSGVGSHNERVAGTIILGKNDSLAVTVKPSAAGDICIAILCYYDDADE